MVDGLDHEEFVQFLNKTHQSLGRQIFIKSLFTHFMQQNEEMGINQDINISNTNDIDATNAILTDIIHSRNIKKHDKNKIRVRMASLPSSLIASTVSYLSHEI